MTNEEALTLQVGDIVVVPSKSPFSTELVAVGGRLSLYGVPQVRTASGTLVWPREIAEVIKWDDPRNTWVQQGNRWPQFPASGPDRTGQPLFENVVRG